MTDPDRMIIISGSVIILSGLIAIIQGVVRRKRERSSIKDRWHGEEI